MGLFAYSFPWARSDSETREGQSTPHRPSSAPEGPEEMRLHYGAASIYDPARPLQSPSGHDGARKKTPVTPLNATPSPTLTVGFFLLPLIVGSLVVWAIRRTSGPTAGLWAAMGLSAWMAWVGGLAILGFLDQWNPPHMFLVFAAILVFLAWAARQPWTERLGTLPLAWLVGFQSFRIVVEILLHAAVREGVAHPTMTWTGNNWDILPGISALLLCPFVQRIKPGTLQIWNISMAGILVVTVGSAMLSAPTPFRQIMGDPANSFVARFPFVWLPAVLVTSAWLGHVVLFRRLRRESSEE